MQQIAAQLAQKAKKVGCDSSQCSLLIADFDTSSTSTSRLGLQLSDEFAALMAKADPKIKLVSRSSLRELMNRNRIPAEHFNDENAVRWLGREMGATAVLTAAFAFKPGSPEAKFKIFDSRPGKKKVESFSAKLPDLTFKDKDLQTIEPYSKLEKALKDEDGEVLPSAGKGGVSTPRCTFTPNPSYTDVAREAKFSGVILMDAVVTRQGSVEIVRVARGLPFDLNEQARRTLETWRCVPATKNGSPVSALVVLEVNFRLY